MTTHITVDVVGAGNRITVLDEVIERHLQACEGLSGAVRAVEDRWLAPSPCSEWDARAVVEHVIGFHDVLLLRPLWLKPHRPKGDPTARWTVTLSAITSALKESSGRIVISVPGSSNMDIARLLALLTTDVLVHTWDLAAAVGVPASLDPELAARAYGEVTKRDLASLRSSGLFGPSVPVSGDADPETRLVALLGRDPNWRGQLGTCRPDAEHGTRRRPVVLGSARPPRCKPIEASP
jgi:uncharacterized protein (TIGR03086 family)